ncbi:hypothetical protein BS50DRAFT_588592 [Corynespora cassiicola Philippines]|uniref:Uncharacterized protein n=1 Tax=Corynespora cassiicola Philippines TaxID=1448308 RepID=A0A2T2NK59_CORCC|nr:hypothetical protein BS50DRAFT_588592 [Corynespora cassiicola Philippines]
MASFKYLRSRLSALKKKIKSKLETNKVASRFAIMRDSMSTSDNTLSWNAIPELTSIHEDIMLNSHRSGPSHPDSKASKTLALDTSQCSVSHQEKKKTADEIHHLPVNFIRIPIEISDQSDHDEELEYPVIYPKSDPHYSASMDSSVSSKEARHLHGNRSEPCIPDITNLDTTFSELNLVRKLVLENLDENRSISRSFPGRKYSFEVGDDTLSLSHVNLAKKPSYLPPIERYSISSSKLSRSDSFKAYKVSLPLRNSNDFIGPFSILKWLLDLALSGDGDAAAVLWHLKENADHISAYPNDPRMQITVSGDTLQSTELENNEIRLIKRTLLVILMEECRAKQMIGPSNANGFRMQLLGECSSRGSMFMSKGDFTELLTICGDLGCLSVQQQEDAAKLQPCYDEIEEELDFRSPSSPEQRCEMVRPIISCADFESLPDYEDLSESDSEADFAPPLKPGVTRVSLNV